MMRQRSACSCATSRCEGRVGSCIPIIGWRRGFSDCSLVFWLLERTEIPLGNIEVDVVEVLRGQIRVGVRLRHHLAALAQPIALVAVAVLLDEIAIQILKEGPVLGPVGLHSDAGFSIGQQDTGEVKSAARHVDGTLSRLCAAVPGLSGV